MDPIAEWNAELQRCRLEVELKRQTERRLKGLDADIAEQRERFESCSRRLALEEEDVAKLVSSSFSQFWLGLFGRWNDRLAEEEKEAAEAKLKFDAASEALKRMEEEREALAAEMASYAGVESRLEALKQIKETWIKENDSAAREELEVLSEGISSHTAELAEVEQAREAGEAARKSLASAEDKLDSARNWGTYDMVGGGMISTMMKHDRIDGARDHVYEAQHHLRRFARELKDLNMHADPAGPEIGGFLHFSDYFFDGLIADWMVQGKIRDSLESVRSNGGKVDEVLGELSRRKRSLETKLAELRVQYAQRVDGYGV